MGEGVVDKKKKPGRGLGLDRENQKSLHMRSWRYFCQVMSLKIPSGSFLWINCEKKKMNYKK